MKLNKYIFAALITSTTLFLGSCSDFLDRSLNPEKPDVPLNKNDAFQKVQKRHVQEKR